MMDIKRLGLGILLVFTLLASGCGFQLRGSVELPSSISPISIEGLGQYDELRRELTTLLRFSNIQIAEESDTASTRLHISHRASDRRVMSVDGNGNVAEYELHEGARFALLDRKGKHLVAEQPVNALMTYNNSETEVLGKSQEEGALRKDMQRDLASQILRRLQAQL